MRIPVFARGSNPAIDQPNQRKSVSYAADEVEAGRADWVNWQDHSQGILCRAFLYSGQTLCLAAPETLSKLARPRRCPLPPLEVNLTRFDDPVKNQTTRDERARLIVSARAIAFFGRPFEIVSQLPS
jgi:hypothetical protein